MSASSDHDVAESIMGKLFLGKVMLGDCDCVGPVHSAPVHVQ